MVTCEEHKNKGSQGGKIETQMNREPLRAFHVTQGAAGAERMWEPVMQHMVTLELPSLLIPLTAPSATKKGIWKSVLQGPPPARGDGEDTLSPPKLSFAMLSLWCALAFSVLSLSFKFHHLHHLLQ